MKITKSYIDRLKYVSMSGKKSVMQITQAAAVQGTKLKYAGAPEYKSIPIGMPNRMRDISYENWEYIFLSQSKSKSCALDCWFNVFYHTGNFIQ